MSKKTELILAVRTAGLPAHINATGFHAMSQVEIAKVLEEAGLFLGPRYLLEDMPEFKQIIPYNVVIQKGEVVHYTRTSKGGESRLYGKVSIGLGGHTDMDDVVRPSDAPSHINLSKTLQCGAYREITEELGVTNFQPLAWAGLIVNNADAVGQVHIGVLGVWELLQDLSFGEVEADLSHVGLKHPTKLKSEPLPEGLEFEAWTAIVLRSGVLYQFTDGDVLG